MVGSCSQPAAHHLLQKFLDDREAKATEQYLDNLFAVPEEPVEEWEEGKEWGEEEANALTSSTNTPAAASHAGSDNKQASAAPTPAPPSHVSSTRRTSAAHTPAPPSHVGSDNKI